MTNIIETINLTKKYGEFTANDKVNLTVKKGEIKAIVGENGAGKTTLMNIIYGLIKPTDGKVIIKGETVDFPSPLAAINLGIGMVHQHFKLSPSLSVYENIFLGIEKHKTIKIKNKTIKTNLIDHKKEILATKELLKKTNFKLSATDKVYNLSVAAKQKVEILKMLYRNVDILIFDEPTAVLTPQETEELFHTLRQMKAEGKTIILISHKLAEVMAISDSITVLKKGKVIANCKTSQTNEAKIAQMMVGRDVLLTVKKEKEAKTNQPVIYQVNNLTVKTSDNNTLVDDVSFQIHQGEILGIAGVEGNGQSELALALCGLIETKFGKVIFNKKDITNKWPYQLTKNKIGFIPEDRYLFGLCSDSTIINNLIAGWFHNKDIAKNGFLQTTKINQLSDKSITKYDIRINSLKDNVSQLSGGNAQKIIIARELEKKPDLLICCQPTRGIDIGAIEFVHKSLINFANDNKGILLISSELSEIIALSDRILVMYKGKILAQVAGNKANYKKIGLLMAGITNG